MTKIKVGINGFGRIGRLVFRELVDRGEVDVVWVNELKGGVVCAAHLVEYDSVHGRWDRALSVTSETEFTLTRPGATDPVRLRFSAHDKPDNIPWQESEVAVVLECTGKFVSSTDAVEGHFKGGSVKKVVVSAPVKKPGKRGDALNIVVGCNDHLYDPALYDVVTAASCTTNCLAPTIKALKETVGIERGLMTTMHDVTNTQVVIDAPHKDLRRARSCMTSMVPTTTGSATAVVKIFPELTGKLNGLAVRVPLLTGSLVDFVFVPSRKTSIEELNKVLGEYAAGDLKGILAVEDKPLVSSDFCSNKHSGIVDLLSTMAVDDGLYKVLIWYDNEMGYSCRMADIAEKVAKSL